MLISTSCLFQLLDYSDVVYFGFSVDQLIAVYVTAILFLGRTKVISKPANHLKLNSVEDHMSENQQQESCTNQWPFHEDPSLPVSSPLRVSSWPDQGDQTENRFRDVLELEKKYSQPSSLTSLKLLNDYSNGFNRFSCFRTTELSNFSAYSEVPDQIFSTVQLLSMAGKRHIQSCTQRVDVAYILDNPFSSMIRGLSGEVAEKVELVEFLMAAADKVENQQFDRANRLLDLCDFSSSNSGNPVQRLVYYFSEALRLRINREMGKTRTDGKCQYGVIDEFTHIPNSTIQACYEGIPFYGASNFAAIQAIIDNIGEAKRVHVINLKIRNGLQCTGLMQAIASRTNCHLELLKITAVETTSRELIEDTGNRLTSFAQGMKIPFCFNTIAVSDLQNLKEELFEIDSEEAVAVYSEYALSNLIVQQDQLASVMRVISNIRPCIMVVIECEASHNSPVFANRFTEALFYFGAYFDCIDACMEQNDPNRMIMESIFLGEGIRNIVATEGKDRDARNVKMDVWRSFFALFGMKEKELSESSLYQAKLVIQKFASGRFCTLGMNEKSLIFGWKGTPILSLSCWKII